MCQLTVGVWSRGVGVFSWTARSFALSGVAPAVDFRDQGFHVDTLVIDELNSRVVILVEIKFMHYECLQMRVG